MLRLTYERLRGFCETCGMLTHDSGACLIQNGGPDNGGADDSGSEDDNLEEDPAPPQGLIIEEIVEADQQEENVGGLDAVVDENMDNEIQVEEIAEEDDALWYGNAMPTMFSEEYNMNEMFNSLSAVGERPDTREALKRKAWMEAANENVSIFTNLEQGESSMKRDTQDARRMKVHRQYHRGVLTMMLLMSPRRTHQRKEARWAHNHHCRHEDSLLELSGFGH
ncbi:hypothetical protein Bca4012_071780 [Brassica carinata]